MGQRTSRARTLELEAHANGMNVELVDLPDQIDPADRKAVESGPGKYWRSVEEDAGLQIVAEFEKRGTLKVNGAAYMCPYDVEKHIRESKGKTVVVGVSYQIAAVMAINSVEETFKVVVELMFRYKIKDEELAVYREYKAKGNAMSFQEMQDDVRIKTKPPVWEIRNAVSEPEFVRERMAGGQRCWDHRTETWNWYATLSAQLRCDCYEEFELDKFPFTRNALQVHLQAKQGFNQVVLVPFNCRSVQPHWVIVESGGVNKAVQTPARGNTFKADRSISNWEVECHHVAFLPSKYCAPMPSGNKFATFIITIQCKQKSTFYIWNTVPVVVFLPILSGAATLESYCNLADRMSIVLALLLTMATYKISVSSWIPQKDYLTVMDKYLIAGFAWILLIGLIVGVSSLLLKFVYVDEFPCEESIVDMVMTEGLVSVMQSFLDGRNPVLLVEGCLVGFLLLVWLLGHVVFLFGTSKLYLGWLEIMAGENDNMKAIAEDCARSHKEIETVKKTTYTFGSKPEPPKDA